MLVKQSQTEVVIAVNNWLTLLHRLRVRVSALRKEATMLAKKFTRMFQVRLGVTRNKN